jgi:hypothetical protein
VLEEAYRRRRAPPLVRDIEFPKGIGLKPDTTYEYNVLVSQHGVEHQTGQVAST